MVRALLLSSSLASACAICPAATLAWQPAESAINASSLGAADNKYGFEDGIVVRRLDGSFVMIASEMYADPKWINMRLGVWSSHDGSGAWTRQRTLRLSSGNYNGSDPHSSSWGPFLVYDGDNEVSYIGYRSALLTLKHVRTPCPVDVGSELRRLSWCTIKFKWLAR
jgi:hypothetical protein